MSLALSLSLAGIREHLGGGSPPPGYTTAAVAFDSAAGLSNASFVVADSPLGLISLWLYPTISGQYAFYGNTRTGSYWTITVGVATEPGDGIICDLWDGATNTLHFRFHADTPTVPLNAWSNYLIGVDANHAAGLKVGKITQSGTPLSVIVDNDTDAAFAVGWGVSGETLEFGQPNNEVDGYAADWWFGFGQYLDVAGAPTIAKFISGGKPVDLGADGSTPTGTAPAIFLRRAPSAAASTFATNLGTGGNFAITGTLTNAPSSPSD